MIDGLAVIDAHMHVPRLSTVTPAWMQWAADFGQDSPWRSVFGPDGDPVTARLDALLEAEGVDAALLFAEYSPRATGVQPVEDLLPLIAYNPGRFRLVANVNPAVARQCACPDCRWARRPAKPADKPKAREQWRSVAVRRRKARRADGPGARPGPPGGAGPGCALRSSLWAIRADARESQRSRDRSESEAN